ncbi:MAG: site-2 protease family protein [Candidatus Acidiferrales bacterium]|jgi:Zn-dependent protease/predicted transcriptional regulator
MTPNGGLRIGRILGIPIYVHSSWFIIFALITLSLRTQFNSQHPAWSPAQHWSLGVITSLLFFASVLFHELAHSVVAMRYKIPVVSITLFVFGGLARIGREAATAGQEFNIAIAGPISSYFLSAAFYLLAHHSGRFEMLGAAAWWLSGINAALATFNLAPGFPLDGGRVLRAIAWGITKDFAKATRIASRSGQLLAYLLILFGVWQAFNGNWVNGLWLAFIGWFLRTAAQETYAQVAIQSTLAGLRAADIMTPDVPTVPRDMSLEDYVQEVLRTGRRCHIVTGNGVPVGLVTLHAVRDCPRAEWGNTSVQAVMRKVDEIQWAAPAESVLGILNRMRERDINQMPVLEEGHIVGIVARDAILRVLQTRIQVGGQLSADRTRP